MQPTHKDFFTTQSTQLTQELERIYIQSQNLFTKYATKSFLCITQPFCDFAKDFDLE